MSISHLFSDEIWLSFHSLAIPYFFILFFPKSKWTTKVVLVYSMIGGAIYGSILVMEHPNLLNVVLYHYSTSKGFEEFLSNVNMRFASYFHIITWDIIVGLWLSRDAQQSGFKNIFRIPFMCIYMHYPPLSLLAYLFIRFVKTKKLPDILATNA